MTNPVPVVNQTPEPIPGEGIRLSEEDLLKLLGEANALLHLERQKRSVLLQAYLLIKSEYSRHLDEANNQVAQVVVDAAEIEEVLMGDDPY